MPQPSRAFGFDRALAASHIAPPIPWLRRRRAARAALEVAAFLVAAGLTAWSAVLAKQAGTVHALAESVVVHVGDEPGQPPIRAMSPTAPAQPQPAPSIAAVDVPPLVAAAPATKLASSQDSSIRWFNGRPVRPAKTLWMQVTAYSPDARSCGNSADGLTATLHSVETNNSQLVAADPRVLKYGSMVSVPGYSAGQIVPVLDCGGAIKGNRLDLLFPTNAQAVKWGKKPLAVTVWEYADGKPADNPRKLR